MWFTLCKSMFDEMGPNFFAPREFLTSFFGNLFAVQNLSNGKSTVCKAFYGKPDFGVDQKCSGQKKRAANV